MSHGMRWWVQLFILLAMSDAGNQPVELGEKGGDLRSSRFLATPHSWWKARGLTRLTFILQSHG